MPHPQWSVLCDVRVVFILRSRYPAPAEDIATAVTHHPLHSLDDVIPKARAFTSEPRDLPQIVTTSECDVKGHGFKSLPCFAEAPSEAAGEARSVPTRRKSDHAPLPHNYHRTARVPHPNGALFAS